MSEKPHKEFEDYGYGVGRPTWSTVPFPKLGDQGQTLNETQPPQGAEESNHQQVGQTDTETRSEGPRLKRRKLETGPPSDVAGRAKGGLDQAERKADDVSME
ncbi:uncharacterized protein N0V89_012104 [Didymosphaeria variabile]|uniref:Uncharacterized protein n=1 Tax=Didymosphaeria variabile TaxID=1932322 RepID=A0A9W8XAE1_9PLEO|nr:uncharacterized protein N0V89_012104 [Didymosphaeria variabile]KAJ4344364.1 hypothetical protein N0V89_012104 [Didymosphaeria variabile]